jgi:hypothetical protein
MYIYEYRKMKPVKIVLRREEGDGMIQGVNLIGMHYMHVWKYHSETPLDNQ